MRPPVAAGFSQDLTYLCNELAWFPHPQYELVDLPNAKQEPIQQENALFFVLRPGYLLLLGYSAHALRHLGNSEIVLLPNGIHEHNFVMAWLWGAAVLAFLHRQMFANDVLETVG